MSSLASSLALLAAVALLGVLGYNLWNSRQRRLKRGAQTRAGEQPAGTADPRGEPSLGAGGDSGAQRAGGADPVPGNDAARGSARGPLDDRTDCLVAWELPAPVSGERLIQLVSGLRLAGTKPIAVEGIAAELSANSGDEAHAWQPPVTGTVYDRVRVGVLLANRHGPLNALEFSEFVSGVQTLAEYLSVLADTPDMNAVLTRARELDEICAQLDAQVELGVECGEALGVAELAAIAAECSCVERGNNRYARLGERGEVLFSLALADAPNRIALLLDVARAPADQQPWQKLVNAAALCAQRLGGALTDDAGRVVAPEHLERIDRQIEQRYQSLENAGFAAGSPLALRLFT